MLLIERTATNDIGAQENTGTNLNVRSLVFIDVFIEFTTLSPSLIAVVTNFVHFSLHL